MAPTEEEEDWGDIGMLPPLKTLQERINNRYDSLFHYDRNGNRHPFVCTVCNEFILCIEDLTWLPVAQLQKRSDLLRWNIINVDSHRDAPRELQETYVFNDADNQLSNKAWMRGMALSPRGVLGRKSKHHSAKLGFSCCNSCKNALSAGCTPFNAIVNRNYVGHAPECLKELSPVELALISPVKGYGYCFSYTGGAQKKLQGTMSFMRVQERATTRALAQLEAMGVSDYVVILLNGNMTVNQKKRAENIIRVDKLLTAVEWLIKSNPNWKDADLDKYRREFESKVPIIVDNSSEEPSENENIETKELFTCYFPDGSLDENLGGFDTREAFKEHVDKMAKNGNFDVSVKLDLEKEFANDNSDIFISACLLQFPYGLGGVNETRIMGDGSLTDKSDIEQYIKHLNRLSEVEFQEPMFQLISYSMICKLKLIRRSRLQLRGKHTATVLANGLTTEDLRSSVRGRAVGNNFAGTRASRTLLKAVDACSQALPHTNEASRSARSTGEAMQHHLGRASVFMTVTFDDENSLLMQILHGTEIDTDAKLKDLSDEELARRSTKRKELRLKFPGLAAINFDMLLNICVEEVIGWSMRKNQSTGKAGLFGICEAFCIAMEEQGRTTVHGHASAWIKKLRTVQERMFFGTKNEKRDANKLLSEYHERVVTTALIRPNRTLAYSFPHECTVLDAKERRQPAVVTDQSLRVLRHKKGYKHTNGIFAVCPHCSKGWTCEELLNQYIHSQAEFITCLPCNPNAVTTDDQQFLDEEKSVLPKARMFARILQFQRKKDADVTDDTPVLCINAAYQHHSSCHVRGCFKCNKFGRGRAHKCSPECECRFRLPDRARPNAQVRTCIESVTWYEWNGEKREQPLVEFLPKRHPFDQFQNASCRVISESKLSCNSNVSLITDGPLGQYQFKYQMKGTQEDDSAPYKEVESSIKALASRSHEDDKKEAVRLICRAAFAHNKKNVIGPSMASYLNEHGQRFYFSHEFVYCPLKDILELLNQSGVHSVAKYNADGSVYFENQALHYLCRSNELEDVSVKEFFEEYHKVDLSFFEKKRKRGDGDDVWPFEADTGHFKHPSTRKRKERASQNNTSAPISTDGATQQSTPRSQRNNSSASRSSGTARKRKKSTTPAKKEPPKTRQGVKMREKKLLIKVSQWMFPDAAKFKANILSCAVSEISNDMEIYAQLVLALFLPHRCLADLKSTNLHGRDTPFTMKLREVQQSDMSRERSRLIPIVFNDENLQFLQNIQDCAHNSMRYKIKNDDLQSVTVPFTDFEDCEDSTDFDDDEDEALADDQSAYNMFLDYVQQNADPNDANPSFLRNSLKNMSFRPIRLKGQAQCGFNENLPVPLLNVETTSESSEFVTFLHNMNTAGMTTPSMPFTGGGYKRRAKKKQIVELLFEKTVSRVRQQVFKYNPTAVVPEANGSITSIQAWGKAATLDTLQTRAFQCIVAAFLLTFFDTDDDDDDATISMSERIKFRRAKKNLLRLKNNEARDDGEQLIMLLHGSGGAGKSTVINLSVAYAKEYCENLIRLCIRCTVVTAMSGVAATLLHGETTHSAIHMNKRTAITDEQIEEWLDCRLVFIDEFSFASEEDAVKIYNNLQILGQNQFKPYGGFNIVFCGDYSQLEPPGRSPIYKGERCYHFHDMINAFIELDGMHRFRDDLPWGRRLMRFRAGKPELEDVRTINKNCLVSETRKPPPGVQVACFSNKDRDAVNCATFERFCDTYKPDDGLFESAVLVFMDSLEMQDDQKNYVGVTSNAVKCHFYTNCGENDCKHGSSKTKRVEPVLKLYPDCPLMMTENKDVPNGQANGSRLYLQSIRIKPSETPMEIDLACGATVRAFFASQVDSLSLRHEQDDIVPSVFQSEPGNFDFTATIKIEGETQACIMKGRQFPLVANTATTGHKLQGYTAISLLVNDWHYGQNWAYVVLSRVRTMDGLYLKEPLTEDLTKYAMPEEMQDMLKEFRDNVWLHDIEEEEIEAMLKFEANSNRA